MRAAALAFPVGVGTCWCCPLFLRAAVCGTGAIAVCLWFQMSAAAFIKGLLDLEGSSLTPILVSLVNKNASMLDAFGKVGDRPGMSAQFLHTLWQHKLSTTSCPPH